MTQKKDMKDGKTHQEYNDGRFYTSGKTQNPKYPEGSTYISHGTKKDHTTGIYDSNGKLIDKQDRGKGHGSGWISKPGQG